MPAILISQALPPENLFASLGVFGVVASLQFFFLMRAEARAKEAQEKTEAMTERVFVLLDKALPLLAETARVLSGSTTVLEQSTRTTGTAALTDILHGIESALANLERKGLS